MKPTNILMTIILSIGMLFLIAPEIDAQDCKCPENAVEVQSEPTSALKVIAESDYPYFLNVRNLKKYSNIKYNGLPVDSYRAGFYTVRSQGRNMKLFATYGKDGNLINGQYIRINWQLPRAVSMNLASDNYKGWTMTGNKIVVHDFNTQKTEYVVKIQKGDIKQTLFFDHTGQPLRRIS